MEGYLFLQHTDSNPNQPIILNDNLYLTKPKDFDDGSEYGGYLIINNIPTSASKIWVSVWFDYAYGETINIGDTRQDIIDKSIDQLKTDYQLNDDVEAPFDMDSYASFVLTEVKSKNCVILEHHPSDPDDDLSAPVLIIKEVNIIH